jgi:hypothetical protein
VAPIQASSAFGLALATILAASTARAQTFEPLDFLPLAPGNVWTYDVDGSESAIEVLPEMEEIGGELAWLLVPTSDDFLDTGQYLTNDGSGLRFHGLEIAIGPADVTVEFDPPILLAPATAPIPSTYESEGDAIFHLVGLDPELSYQATSRIVGVEPVDVPAGTFDAVRLELEFQIGGEILGQGFDLTGSSTQWLATGVGRVRSIDVLDDDTTEAELVSFAVPEPDARLLGGAAIGALLSLGRLGASRRPE